MLLADLLGTDPLSFESLDDRIFDKNFLTGFYARHHKDSANKQSMALYDLILSNSDYHNDYKQISTADQEVLEQGVKRLTQLALDKSDFDGDGKISIEDIRNVFRGVTVVFKGATMTVENLWKSF